MLHQTDVTQPVLRKLYASAVARNDAELAAWSNHLRALYDHEVHTTIESEPTQGSRPLTFWREYFKLHPSRYNVAVKRRLTYARQTKVTMAVPFQLLRMKELVK